MAAMILISAITLQIIFRQCLPEKSPKFDKGNAVAELERVYN